MSNLSFEWIKSADGICLIIIIIIIIIIITIIIIIIIIIIIMMQLSGSNRVWLHV